MPNWPRDDMIAAIFALAGTLIACWAHWLLNWSEREPIIFVAAEKPFG